MGAGQSPTASTPLREGPPSCVGIRETPALWRVFDFSECTLPGPSWLLGFSRALSPCGCRPPQASLWADLSLPDPGTRPSPPAPGPDPETPLHRLWPGAWCSAWPGVAWPHRAGTEAAGPPCSARAAGPAPRPPGLRERQPWAGSSLLLTATTARQVVGVCAPHLCCPSTVVASRSHALVQGSVLRPHPLPPSLPPDTSSWGSLCLPSLLPSSDLRPRAGSGKRLQGQGVMLGAGLLCYSGTALGSVSSPRAAPPGPQAGPLAPPASTLPRPRPDVRFEHRRAFETPPPVLGKTPSVSPTGAAF